MEKKNGTTSPKAIVISKVSKRYNLCRVKSGEDHPVSYQRRKKGSKYIIATMQIDGIIFQRLATFSPYTLGDKLARMF